MWGWLATTARAVGGACLHVLESPAAGTLIFTTVCLSSLILHKKKKKNEEEEEKTWRSTRPLTRSMSTAMLQGGYKAMQRFKLSHDASRNEGELAAAVDDMRVELQKPRIDFGKLYAYVGALETSGKEKEAIELLEDALKRQKEAKPSEPPHEVHELELLLVEMNIYKGDYEKALDYPCMKREDVSSSADSRVHLYRAVIHTMMNDEERARKSYDMMREIQQELHGQKSFEGDSSMSLHQTDFDEFAEVMKRLMQEIREARSGTPAAEAQKSQQELVAADGKTEGEGADAPNRSEKAAAGNETDGETTKGVSKGLGKTEGTGASSAGGEKELQPPKEESKNAHSGTSAGKAQQPPKSSSPAISVVQQSP